MRYSKYFYIYRAAVGVFDRRRDDEYLKNINIRKRKLDFIKRYISS